MGHLRVREIHRTIRDVDVPQWVIREVLREDMAVKMRCAMPHHQVVDLPRIERLVDGPARALDIPPERAELSGIQLTEVGDMLAEDDDGIAGMRLVSHQSYVSHLGRGHEDAVLVLRKTSVDAHPAELRVHEFRPLLIRPPHRPMVTRGITLPVASTAAGRYPRPMRFTVSSWWLPEQP
jgi:hypothetical protein